MSKLVDIVSDRRQAQEKYFNNWRSWSEKIKTEAQKLLGPVEVFVFGSILKEEETPRDIDILIVSSKVQTTAQKSKTRAQLWDKIGFYSPFEIHLSTPQEYEGWYKLLIKQKVQI